MNDNVDIPFLSEKTEEKIFNSLYDTVEGVIKNAIKRNYKDKRDIDGQGKVKFSYLKKKESISVAKALIQVNKFEEVWLITMILETCQKIAYMKLRGLCVILQVRFVVWEGLLLILIFLMT